MESQVKPGTRCECPDPDCECRKAIPADAVRIVAVPAVTGGASRPEWQALGYGAKKRVPMCAPCAAYHESKEAR